VVPLDEVDDAHALRVVVLERLVHAQAGWVLPRRMRVCNVHAPRGRRRISPKKDAKERIIAGGDGEANKSGQNRAGRGFSLIARASLGSHWFAGLSGERTV